MIFIFNKVAIPLWFQHSVRVAVQLVRKKTLPYNVDTSSVQCNSQSATVIYIYRWKFLIRLKRHRKKS